MTAATNIVESVRAYETWLRAQLGVEFVARDINGPGGKHDKMDSGAFPFLRATYWRWSERALDKSVCRDLGDAPEVLAVGDIHLENFGTWRDADGRLAWGVNDFDEAAAMPYALDLVRLAASAILAAGAKRPAAERICSRLVAGYAAGLACPQAIILDEAHANLRKLAIVGEPDRKRFWARIGALRPDEKGPPERFVRALTGAMPGSVEGIRFFPRQAGAGSLGRPRWVAIANWCGAPVIREAKAIVSSAWTLVPGRGVPATRSYEIASGRYRAPDPWYASPDNIVVRRLSPNNRKMDSARDIGVLLKRDTLRAMGSELANIHLGNPGHRRAIEKDLRRRGDEWLADAARRAVRCVVEDFAAWTARPGKRRKRRT